MTRATEEHAARHAHLELELTAAPAFEATFELNSDDLDSPDHLPVLSCADPPHSTDQHAALPHSSSTLHCITACALVWIAAGVFLPLPLASPAP